MAVFGTSGIVNLPRQIADGMVKDLKTTSTIAALSNQEPMRFGDVDIVTFNDAPKAEFVEEGADKSATTGSFGVVTATPHKAQVTMRFNQEVQWADDDYQLGVLSELANAGKVALSRALDLGVYHRINPLTGTWINSWTNYLSTTTNIVTGTTNPDIDIESAVGLLVNNQKPVTGIALDPRMAWTLATARYADGRKKYPELGFGVNVSNFEGLPVSVGDTVSGLPEAAFDMALRAIVGDFAGGIRWGIQREIPLELIQFGDPDGQGDLKRKNQIALRLEIAYAWYVFPERFAVVKTATPVSTATTPAAPAAGGTAATPATGGTAATPATGGTAATPTAGGTAATPAAGGTAATPAAGGTAATPATGGTAATPAVNAAASAAGATAQAAAGN